MIGTSLLRALQRADLPAVGVDMRDPADLTTWRIQYRRALTDAEEDQVAAVLASFDAAAAADQEVGDAFEATLDQAPLLHALLLWTAQRLGVSPGEARSELLTIYRRIVTP